MKREEKIYIEDIYSFSSDVDLHSQHDDHLCILYPVVSVVRFFRTALTPAKDNT